MNLKQAVESGRPFRHKTQIKTYWCTVGTFGSENYSLTDLVSSDWEIQQKETFTRKDVERALVKLADYLSSTRVQSWQEALEEAMRAAETP